MSIAANSIARFVDRFEGRLVLKHEPWATYERLVRHFDERRHLRITYNEGILEIMTLGPDHEGLRKFIARLFEELTQELDLPLAAYGSLTFKRRRKLKGLEPDECYWIQNELKARNLTKEFNFRRDPPPDLVIEIDITSSSARRMEIYQDLLAVPKVWRHDGESLQFHLLGRGGYKISAKSRTFPGLRATDLAPFLAMRGKTDVNTIIRRFRDLGTRTDRGEMEVSFGRRLRLSEGLPSRKGLLSIPSCFPINPPIRRPI